MNNTLIIAEAGVNHNGSIDLAKKLIDVAANAGADYVKFQTFISELNISKKAGKAEYQKDKDEKNEKQLEMVQKLELSFEEFEYLKRYCQKNGIGFLSTAFDFPSIDFLDQLDLSFFKSPSGEITNFPYLKRLAEKGKPVILSTGMANISEVKQALIVLTEHGLTKDQIIILHCNTEYPTPMEDVNLKAMNTIADELGVEVGYSDHTLGIEVPIAAVARGAKVIEKHFTLDRELPGPDHRASLEPDALKAMVEGVRNIEKALAGDGRKVPSKSEFKNKEIARKSIHLARDVAKGNALEEEDLIPLRPGNGISAMEWDKVIGKRALKPLHADDQLKWEFLQ